MKKWLLLPLAFVFLAAGGFFLIVLAPVVVNPTPQASTNQSQAQPVAVKGVNSLVPQRYLNICMTVGKKYHIRWNFLCGIVKVESNFGTVPGSRRQDGSNFAGAAGPCQIGIGGASSKTWQSETNQPVSHVYNPRYCIPVAAKILAGNGATSVSKESQAAFWYNHGRGATYNPADNYPNLVAHYASSFAKTQTTFKNVSAAIPSGKAAAILNFGKVLVRAHTPYVWGGDGTDNPLGGFDCSGLTSAAYASVGVSIPRTADLQYRSVHHVAKPMPGDLVFFGSRSYIHHVGLFYKQVGNTWWMLDAPHTGAFLRIEKFKVGKKFVNGWSDYVTAGRP